MKFKKVFQGILVVCLLQCWLPNFGAVFGPAPYSARLTWETSPDPSVAGYRIHYGLVSRHYFNSIDVGNVTAKVIMGLQGGASYFFAVTSYDVDGKESPYSDELVLIAGTPTLKLGHTKSGQLALTVTGLIGHAYEIQASPDCKTWTSIGRVKLETSPSIEFTPKNFLNLPYHFYRTHDTQP